MSSIQIFGSIMLTASVVIYIGGLYFIKNYKK